MKNDKHKQLAEVLHLQPGENMRDLVRRDIEGPYARHQHGYTETVYAETMEKRSANADGQTFLSKTIEPGSARWSVVPTRVALSFVRREVNLRNTGWACGTRFPRSFCSNVLDLLGW